MARRKCTPASHDALRTDDARWAKLKRLGDMRWPWGEVFELRDCPRCGSTLARPKMPEAKKTAAKYAPRPDRS